MLRRNPQTLKNVISIHRYPSKFLALRASTPTKLPTTFHRPLRNLSTNTSPPSNPDNEISPNPTSSKPPTKQSKLQTHLPLLHNLSKSTKTPLPSLIISFAILHELTALIPLIILFYIFELLGSGAIIVEWISSLTSPPATAEEGEGEGSYWKKTVGGWFEEGQKRVEKVGRKYGILGYRKIENGCLGDLGAREGDGDVSAEDHDLAVDARSSGRSLAVEKVANAISAYVLVKALLPVRIGVSIAAAPAFARFALEPFRRIFIRRPPPPQTPI